MRLSKLAPAMAILMCFGFSVMAAVRYVDLKCSNPVPPYTDWQTAATNIQDAIDAAADGDLVLVTNGIYANGGQVVYGMLTNRVAINKAITVQSVNGPTVTAIQGNPALGNNAIRCVYMANGSLLSGFTLTNGGTMTAGDSYLDDSGGGIWATNNSSAVISNCVVINNSANFCGAGGYYGNFYNCSILQNTNVGSGGGVAYSVAVNCLVSSNLSYAYGGGAWVATLTNCQVLSNVAAFDGGGAANSSLYGCLVAGNVASGLGGGIDLGQTIVNCTITGNASTQGGGGVNGASSQTFENNIIYYNTVSYGTTPNYSGLLACLNCCTTPLPAGSALQFGNNFTNDPGFVDFTNGDFHLSSTSPCINSGIGYPAITTDLDGNPRLVGGFQDIGAYENQTAGFVLPYQFAQKYNLPVDGTIDSDGDGMQNWQEAIAGTNPTNALSVLKMLSVSNSISGTTVKWQSIAFKVYHLQRATNLLGNPAFVAIYTNVGSIFTTLSFKDTTATGNGPYFYRVSVE